MQSHTQTHIHTHTHTHKHTSRHRFTNSSVQRYLLFCQISFPHTRTWQNREPGVFERCPGLIACCWQRLLEGPVLADCRVACWAFCTKLWDVIIWMRVSTGEQKEWGWALHRTQIWATEKILIYKNTQRKKLTHVRQYMRLRINFFNYLFFYLCQEGYVFSSAFVCLFCLWYSQQGYTKTIPRIKIKLAVDPSLFFTFPLLDRAVYFTF